MFGLLSSALCSAGMSLYGMFSKPGMKGPKPPKDSGSVDDETAARVRPQKFPLAKRTTAWSFGTPLTS